MKSNFLISKNISLDVTVNTRFLPMHSCYIYEGWDFNSGNYLFTTDTK